MDIDTTKEIFSLFSTYVMPIILPLALVMIPTIAVGKNYQKQKDEDRKFSLMVLRREAYTKYWSLFVNKAKAQESVNRIVLMDASDDEKILATKLLNEATHDFVEHTLKMLVIGSDDVVEEMGKLHVYLREIGNAPDSKMINQQVGSICNAMRLSVFEETELSLEDLARYVPIV